MVRVEVTGDHASFLFGRFEHFLTWTKRLDVPLRHISSVSTDRAPTNFVGGHQGGIAVGFTFSFKVPFLPWGGQIRTPDLHHLLVTMRNPERCITILLVSEPFDTLILDVGDKWRVSSLLKEACAAVR